MNTKLYTLVILLSLTMFFACNPKEKSSDMNIVFLHHSTGESIWNGTKPSSTGKIIHRFSSKLASKLGVRAHLPALFHQYNKESNKNYNIEDRIFPKNNPYGWNNYPFDYYNIWVKNAGEQAYMEEPTLEMLTKKYQVIIFKHCFPVSNISEGSLDSSNVDSDEKTLENYQLQYQALRDKLHEFPETKFILFTGAVNVKANMTEDEAIRAKTFFDWVKNEWDQSEDNIYLWDLYNLQTEGGLYFKEDYAISLNDSHPNKTFSGRVVKLLFNRIVDIIERDGNGTSMTGEKI